MRLFRSACAALLLAVLSLGLVSATPGRAEAYHYGWHGFHRYPYYWNRGYYYNPYRAYSPYYNWYGRYGGYYGAYPYYSWYRAYPWGWYW